MVRSLMLSMFLMVAFSHHALSQITIANEFQPNPGTTLRSNLDLLPDSAYYASASSGMGGPIIWDFSSRTYGLGFESRIVEPSSTPEIDSFPNANLVLETIVGADTTWSIHRSDPNVFVRQGTVTRGSIGELMAIYRNIAADWVFPIAYGNQWTAYRHWTQLIPPNRAEILDTTFNVVDAWGTARRGSRDVPCLRVMSRERITYNIYDESNQLIMTLLTDIHSANFVAAGFNTLVTVSRIVQTFGSTYNSSASGDFISQPGAVDENETVPDKVSLSQNYPNPFNPATTIQYILPKTSTVTLEIFDLLGRKVESLVEENQPAGNYQVNWDAKNILSGIYFYQLRTEYSSEVKKMVLLK